MNSDEPVVLSPEDYEKAVAEMLRASEHGLAEFDVTHRKVLQGQDGDYEIDVLARFKALGGDFKVLIECKHHRSPVKRDVVQVLKDRLHSTGSQKGMIFSTSGFQKGAIEYSSPQSERYGQPGRRFRIRYEIQCSRFDD
jgi:restriction system protein